MTKPQCPRGWRHWALVMGLCWSLGLGHWGLQGSLVLRQCRPITLHGATTLTHANITAGTSRISGTRDKVAAPPADLVIEAMAGGGRRTSRAAWFSRTQGQKMAGSTGVIESPAEAVRAALGARAAVVRRQAPPPWPASPPLHAESFGPLLLEQQVLTVQHASSTRCPRRTRVAPPPRQAVNTYMRRIDEELPPAGSSAISLPKTMPKSGGCGFTRSSAPPAMSAATSTTSCVWTSGAWGSTSPTPSATASLPPCSPCS